MAIAVTGRGRPRPSQSQLILPIIEALAAKPGAARARDVANELGERFGIPPSEIERTVPTSDGQAVGVWHRHVRFARQKAAQMGYLASAGHALWQATDEGREGLSRAAARISVRRVPATAGAPAGTVVDVGIGLPTTHALVHGDSRDLSWLPDGAVELCVSSVPYFDLKDYSQDDGQLSLSRSYDEFLDGLSRVLREILRVLVPGGRLACNAGDVLRSRKRHGTHHVLPLTSDIMVRSRDMGFQPLTGIDWRKRGNVSYEQGGRGMLGKPGQPNGVIPLEREAILLLRKPGGYRHPTAAQRALSAIGKEERDRWFRGSWADVPGARATPEHPAPFPLEVPSRLIRMFSFAGDTVLDPFAGSCSTAVAAAQAGRNSISVDVHGPFLDAGIARLERAMAGATA